MSYLRYWLYCIYCASWPVRDWDTSASASQLIIEHLDHRHMLLGPAFVWLLGISKSFACRAISLVYLLPFLPVDWYFGFIFVNAENTVHITIRGKMTETYFWLFRNTWRFCPNLKPKFIELFFKVYLFLCIWVLCLNVYISEKHAYVVLRKRASDPSNWS